MTERAPRQIAADLVENFVKGGQLEIPENNGIAQVALTEARNAAALIVHHARKARDDRAYARQLGVMARDKKHKMHSLANLALRYNAVRARKAA